METTDCMIGKVEEFYLMNDKCNIQSHLSKLLNVFLIVIGKMDLTGQVLYHFSGKIALGSSLFIMSSSPKSTRSPYMAFFSLTL